MRWARHVACIGRRGMHASFFVEKPEEKRSLGILNVDGRIISKFIFKKYDGVVWTGLIFLRIGDQ
jgi:hypothetical protein